MENHENNPFINAMTNTTSESANRLNTENDNIINSGSEISINQSPERFLRGLATFTLWLGIIASVIMFIVALVLFSDYGNDTAWILMGTAFVAAFISIVEWAVLKVFTNISCNLFNIVAELKNNR